MKRVIRKCYKVGRKKLYSIDDPSHGISVGNFKSRRKAEAALREAKKQKQDYLHKIRTFA